MGKKIILEMHTQNTGITKLILLSLDYLNLIIILYLFLFTKILKKY